MIYRHCKFFVDFPPNSLPMCVVSHYGCGLQYKNTHQWSLTLESSWLNRKYGFHEAVMARKLKEIKAADKVQKIKHWRWIEADKKKRKHDRHLQIFLDAHKHTSDCLGQTEFPLMHRRIFPYIAGDSERNLALNTGLTNILMKYNWSRHSKIQCWDKASNGNRTSKNHLYVQFSSSFSDTFTHAHL